jgi:hypothetical protein
MTSSPMISSVTLHLIVISILWCCVGAGRQAPPPPQLYLELAGVQLGPTSQAPALPKQPEPEQIMPEKGESQPPVAKQEAAPVELPPAPIPVSAPAPLAPEMSRAFAGASRMQEMMHRTHRYYELAGMAVRKVLEGKLPVGERRLLEGESAQILVSYGDGAAPEFAVTSENRQLQAVLENDAAWSHIPSPRDCLLPYKKVTFLVSVQRGAFQIGLAPQ